MGNHCCTSDKNTEAMDTRGEGVVRRGKVPGGKP